VVPCPYRWVAVQCAIRHGVDADLCAVLIGITPAERARAFAATEEDLVLGTPPPQEQSAEGPRGRGRGGEVIYRYRYI